LSIIEFVDNNIIFFETNISLFFVNKSYYLHIFFSSNNISYSIACKRFEATKAKDITRIIQNILKIMQDQFKKTQKTINRQTNKYRRKFYYNIDNKIFLFSRNIVIDRFCKKLKNKILNSFSIVNKTNIFYKLNLSLFIKIYNAFYINLLYKNFDNFLSSQVQELFESIITFKNNKYKLNNILNSR